MNNANKTSFLALAITGKLPALIEEGEHRHGLTTTAIIDGPEGEVYFRVSRRRIEELELLTVYFARIEILPQYMRRGIFTDVLHRVQRCATLYGCHLIVENVLNPHLERWLPRHDFKQMPESIPPVFYKTRARLREEHADLMDAFIGAESCGAVSFDESAEGVMHVSV